MYVAQYFQQEYGVPYDERLLKVAQQNGGILTLLDHLKREFILAQLEQVLSKGQHQVCDIDYEKRQADIKRVVDGTVLAQLFLTIQPSQEEMVSV